MTFVNRVKGKISCKKTLFPSYVHCTFLLVLYLQCRTYGTVSVEVKKTQHKYIVGPRGQGLQEVLQTTGVWVEVPPSDSDVNTITLRGPQEKLGQALTVVNLPPTSLPLSLSLSPSLSFLPLTSFLTTSPHYSE